MAKKKPTDPPGRKPYERADKAEVARRVEAVLRVRLDGAQLHDLPAWGADQTPPVNVSERQWARYLEQADELIRKRTERRRGRLLGLHVARREALYARAVNAADYSTALRVLADLAHLQRLYLDAAALRDVARRLAELEKRFGLTTPETRAARVAPGTSRTA